MNACSFCKQAKRKCNKARPSCSNCLRLHRDCTYTEDNVQTHFAVHHENGRRLSYNGSRLSDAVPDYNIFRHGPPQQPLIDTALRIIGSSDEMLVVATEFFTGTYQRLPAISRLRYLEDCQSLTTRPRADFATLCLAIILLQQMPTGKSTNVQSPLYATVKNFINLLEASNDFSIDLVHCRVLVTYYEMGHGLHQAAYLSIAACARIARLLGLHRKMRRVNGVETDKIGLEEARRTWWAIVIMDKFINLCNGDALLVTDDPVRTDPLPIDDLVWSESPNTTELEGLISTPPALDTPFSTTVGQMARECQVSYLAGRVVRHVFDEPMPDREFFLEEGTQLERTLKAYLPLLANEELKIGKYCGAFGVCNSALFILYEFTLNQGTIDNDERDRILQSIEETSLRATNFAEASYSDRAENYPHDVLSPYLTYSLYQAAIVQHRLWRQTGDVMCRRRLDSLKSILGEFTQRWMIAWQYLAMLEDLDQSLPPLALPFQGIFISTGNPTTT